MIRKYLPAALASVGLVACGGDYGSNLPFDPDTGGGPGAGVFFVSNADSDDITVVDSQTLATTTVDCTTINVIGREPRNMAVSHDGSTVYVPFRQSDRVAVLPVAALDITAVITDPGLDEPYAAAFTADDSEVWVVNK
jgi:DNA-binding beta-propeller fold protein YncE